MRRIFKGSSDKNNLFVGFCYAERGMLENHAFYWFLGPALWGYFWGPPPWGSFVTLKAGKVEPRLQNGSIVRARYHREGGLVSVKLGFSVSARWLALMTW